MRVNFQRLTWENYPSTETPINADNLNRLEEGVAGLYSDMTGIEEGIDSFKDETSAQVSAMQTRLTTMEGDIDSFEEITLGQVGSMQTRVTSMENGLPTMVGEQIDTKFGDDIGDNVTAWLTEHVNPAGSAVVVDDTLTIEDAAADAKKTGDEISSVKDDLDYVTDVDYTWTIGKTISSTGTESSSIVGAMTAHVPVEGGNLITRPYPVKDDNGVNIIIHVCQYVDGVFQSRTSLSVSGLTLDSATTSVRFNIARAASTGITMTQEDADKYFTANLHRKFDLLAEAKNKLQGLSLTSSIAQNAYGKLLTNLPANIFSWAQDTWFTDSPATGYFYIINLHTISISTFAPMSGQGTQIAIYPDNGAIFVRRVKSGNWTGWVSNRGVFPVYYAFGDSLTWGAVWDNNQATDLYQADYIDQIPTRIAHAIGSITFANYGASGARFVPQSGDSSTKKTIVDMIKETTFTGVDIVTIGGGRNDSATPLGDGDTATANDGTICGAVVDALEYLTSNYPKLQIIMYGVTPQPTSTAHAPSDIYTRVFSGGWSLTTYYQEMKKVCDRYGVPFIDWYDCTLILRWGVLSGGYSGGTQNWSHPLSSDIYKQMGNYLGGKVSSCYSG